MKLILTLLTAIIISSCGTIKELNHDNYILYYKTKAFFVLEDLGYKLIVENAQQTQMFRIFDYENIFEKSDTIIAYYNQWIYKQLKFIK